MKVVTIPTADHMAVLALLGAASFATAGEIHEAVAAGDAARVQELLAADPSLASAPEAAPSTSSRLPSRAPSAVQPWGRSPAS